LQDRWCENGDDRRLVGCERSSHIDHTQDHERRNESRIHHRHSADYDPTHPYRLIISWHQAYGSDTGNANGLHPAGDGPNFDAKDYAYFGLHREATNANQPAVFVAPQGIGDFPWDYDRDVALFDDLLALVDANLCIDDSRVFTTGFSFGAMMSYALSLGRPSKLRAAVTMAAANYNFTQPTNTHTPLAYMGTTGMSDGTCPWGDDKQGGKACVLQHAKDNGCTIPADITTATKGSKKYLCYDFEGCKAGYLSKCARSMAIIPRR
jgi:predicted esterase